MVQLCRLTQLAPQPFQLRNAWAQPRPGHPDDH
jgi:hypothetical protein